MSELIMVVPFMVFVGVTLAVMVALTPRSVAIRARLQQYAAAPELADLPGEYSRSFFDRLILPGLKRLTAFANRVAPDTIADDTARKLQQAGSPAFLTVGTFLLLKALLVLVLPGVYGVYLWKTGTGGPVQLGILLAQVYVGFRLPDWLLERRIGARRALINRTLPDALDLMVISIEAGLGFDAALAQVADRMEGPLADETRRTLAEMSMGKRRRDALRDMAERCQAPDLTSFVAAVVQADQTGVSIGQVLRVQADAMRLRRRQRAQEEGRKAPMKMLFPMIFFILPATFAVVLGPAILQIIDNFASFSRR